jgi:RNA 2',3'-cyclic 3'-phosphodiesterase
VATDRSVATDTSVATGARVADPGPVNAAVRCFVALPVPAHVRALVAAATAPARERSGDLTWTRPEGWHVTLAFLGNVDADRVDAVGHVVAGITAGTAPIACELGEVGRFGHRALWLGIDDDPAGAIARLGEDLQAALAAADIQVERREVRPHLTVARAKRRGTDLASATEAVAPVGAGWEADAVELVRSELGDGPARYTAIGSWHLGVAPGPGPT